MDDKQPCSRCSRLQIEVLDALACSSSIVQLSPVVALSLHVSSRARRALHTSLVGASLSHGRVPVSAVCTCVGKWARCITRVSLSQCTPHVPNKKKKLGSADDADDPLFALVNLKQLVGMDGVEGLEQVEQRSCRRLHSRRLRSLHSRRLSSLYSRRRSSLLLP